ncbi:SdpI family protein [Arthrobacter zhaoxinii]|uniref:SdpI family protein n=1 Tax=Arthrobacter zhaoxinii TaxID=2964616 RepID=UPI0021044561|nr:SdpI family protein [Arthrobacter zhaoxinii]MCQ2001223.1 SdpI family protein [Arthrobacter zhaoxinii]
MGFTGIVMLMCGLGLSWAAEATARGKVCVNGLIGIRTGYVTASPEAWLAGHQAARGLTHAAAAVFMVTGILTLVFDGTEGVLAVGAIAGSLGVLALILAAASRANHAAKRVVAAGGTEPTEKRHDRADR